MGHYDGIRDDGSLNLVEVGSGDQRVVTLDVIGWGGDAVTGRAAAAHLVDALCGPSLSDEPPTRRLELLAEGVTSVTIFSFSTASMSSWYWPATSSMPATRSARA
ncbi:hypothetical protein [Ornithinimicrobium murale]|uniref:hypothetical protein n=1 Tax=Ornithinimicrobium murale TaxID=1050153 RepID=UPI0013B4475C|nr:hypothetical protein [Ornithinimicrobium murale]